MFFSTSSRQEWQNLCTIYPSWNVLSFHSSAFIAVPSRVWEGYGVTVLKKVYGEGDSRCKPANPGSPGRMTVELACVCTSLLLLVVWLSGRMSVSDQRTFPGMHQTCSWWATIYMGKPSSIGQLTMPNQPFILLG